MLSAGHFHIAVGAIRYRRANFCNQVTLFWVAQRLNQFTLEGLVSVDEEPSLMVGAESRVQPTLPGHDT